MEISCFWDGGWSVALGDNMNGYKRPKWQSCELHEVIPALQELILEHYPNSTYAQNLKKSWRRKIKDFLSDIK